MEPSEIKWNELTFSLMETRTMFISTCKEGEQWKDGKLIPYGNIPMSPAAGVLNYGQGAFEGMKAYRTHDNKNIVLFRPQENAHRMASSCKRLCMPPIPEEFFMQAVLDVVKANIDYIPPYRPDSSAQGSLYLRPLVIGSGPILGVKPAPEYTFLVYASPVGPYFKSGFQPIKLKVDHHYHRAVKGGTGGVKAIGNYSGGLYPAKLAKNEGFSEVLYLDGSEDTYIEEVGAANFFCIKDNALFTPELNGVILPGITRNSVIRLAQDRFGLKIVEGHVTLTQALESDEAFASGTAAVISPVGSIYVDGQNHVIGNGQVGKFTEKIYNTLLNIQHGIEPDPYGWIVKVIS